MGGFKRVSAIMVAATVLWASAAQAAVVLNNQFTQWHYSSTNTANFYTSADASSLTWKSSVTSSLVSVTFPKQDLAVGESLSAQFTFSANNIASAAVGFRVALFNSNGNPITDNGTGISNEMYRGYAGYAGMTDLGSSNNNAQIDYRPAGTATDTSQNLLGSGYPKPLGSTTASANLTSGTSSTGTLKVTRTATGVQIEFALGGTNLSYTDSTLNYVSFDSLVFQVVPAQAERVVFTDVTIAKTAVPEPASAGMLLGSLAGVGLLAGRRLFRKD